MAYSVFELFRLAGKVALVVGGARHLGYDMAEALAEAGADVVVTSREEAAADRAARCLAETFPIQARAFALDHRNSDRVAEVFGAAVRWRGRIDILVNNAGGGSGVGPCHVLEREPAEAENLIATNLIGTLHCCQAAARTMVEKRAGKIVNVASVAGLVGRDRRMYARHGLRGQPVDYAAAKAGVIGLTRDLAATLAPYGVYVNAISPGGFARPEMPPSFVREYSDRTPVGRMGRDGIDMKGAVLFLASAASDYVTGQNLVVDGGFSTWQ